MNIFRKDAAHSSNRTFLSRFINTLDKLSRITRGFLGRSLSLIGYAQMQNAT
jgi:hypothetical protein